jgi:CRISPR-associated endonuclease/helicase Cas3
MRQQKAIADADVSIASEQEAKEDKAKSTPDRNILIWRGKDDSFVTTNPRDIRPGDTVVIPATEAYHDSLSLGHIPPRADGTILFDVAEAATAKARRQRIVRIHPDIHPELKTELLDYAKSEELFLTRRQIRDLLDDLAEDFTTGPEEMDYPHPESSSKPGIVLRFNALLPQSDPLVLPTPDDDEDASSDSTMPIPLADHLADVGRQVRVTLGQLSPGHATTLGISADLHDLGKADLRFNAMLAGITPYEAIERKLLAKSGQRGLSKSERAEQAKRAMLPKGFRHEMLSVQLVEHYFSELVRKASVDRDLLLHLIAAHHGQGRPFAPVVVDEADDETRSIEVSVVTVTPEQRKSWPPAHRLDSGIAERFWDLTRKHGWWGLAWLECTLRLADQQASASQQANKPEEGVAK